MSLTPHHPKVNKIQITRNTSDSADDDDAMVDYLDSL